MELFERRRYYFCRYCGTFHFIETAPIDGVQILERQHTGMPCPLCSAPLYKSLLDDQHIVHHCERCRGLLASRRTFGDTVTQRRARQAGPPATPVPIDPRELKRELACPSCRARLEVHPYYGPGNIVIDTCSACDLVWLDAGELKQIAEAPGRDRGRVPAPRYETEEHQDSDHTRTWSTLGDAMDDLFGM